MNSEEEKKAIEYLKARLYGNEGCELIDVAQSDLCIIIKLADRVLKADKNWQEIYDEQEENIREKNNKICEFEFIIEKQQKEIEHWKAGMQIVERDKNNHIERLEKELDNLKEIEKTHKEENGKLRIELEQYKLLEANIDKANKIIAENKFDEGLYGLLMQEKEKNKEAREYMYDLLNADIPNVGTDDINNLLSILEEK